LLPWLTRAGSLGDDVLEIGPGPGLTTDLLRSLAPHVTAVELDQELAAALEARLAETNVDVIQGDGSATGLDAGRFSTVVSFSMMHHVPTPEIQDRVLAEMNRVLRPGGSLLLVDSLDVEAIRLFHEDDIFVPFDLESLGARLGAAGFADPDIETSTFEFRLRATKL